MLTATNPAWSNADFSKKSLATLASQVLYQALSVSNIQAGFAKTSIYPLNPKTMDTEYGPSTLFEELDDANSETSFEENDTSR